MPVNVSCGLRWMGHGSVVWGGGWQAREVGKTAGWLVRGGQTWQWSRMVVVVVEGGGVKGHLSVSLPPLSFPTTPPVHMHSPHTSAPSPYLCTIPIPLHHPHTSAPSLETTPQSWQPLYSKSDDFPDVDSSEVVDILRLPPLVPQWHWTCLRHIRIGSRDTTAPSAVMWKASYGRLGTRRLGTVITSTYFVVRPSQGSLECYPWISPD
jgi:hypothetical protein